MSDRWPWRGWWHSRVRWQKTPGKELFWLCCPHQQWYQRRPGKIANYNIFIIILFPFIAYNHQNSRCILLVFHISIIDNKIDTIPKCSGAWQIQHGLQNRIAEPREGSFPLTCLSSWDQEILIALHLWFFSTKRDHSAYGTQNFLCQISSSRIGFLFSGSQLALKLKKIVINSKLFIRYIYPFSYLSYVII